MNFCEKESIILEKKRVILFGSIGIAKKCLEEIILKKDIDFLGACCVPLDNSWRKEESVYEFCMENNFPILSLEEVKHLKADIGFSIRFNKIITDEIINSFTVGIFNTHGGILPEYRGVYSNVNAILNNENEYGVTLHYIDRGIDEGDIVSIKKTKILETDTGFSLYKKGEQLCYEILLEQIDSILDGTNTRITQKIMIEEKGKTSKTFTYNNTLNKKYIDQINLNKNEDNNNMRIIRAFDSPFHEPAYTCIDGTRIYLRTTWTKGSE